MSVDAAVKLVLVIGIVLIVVAIGLRARIENPLLLVRRPTLALRAMIAMFVLLPLFALMVTRLLPLQQGVGAALLLASEVFPDSERAILGTVLPYLIASIAITLPHQRWRVKVLAIADVSAVDPRRRSGGP
jgi:predicted Na+-dependent transporter